MMYPAQPSFFAVNVKESILLSKIVSIFLVFAFLILTGCSHHNKHGHVPPGHDPAGPGNSENAPGHNKNKKH